MLRNYVVYRGDKIKIKDLFELLNKKYRDDVEITSSKTINNVTFFRNNLSLDDDFDDDIDYNEYDDSPIFEDFPPYQIHQYREYTYIYDCDITDINLGIRSYLDFDFDPDSYSCFLGIDEEYIGPLVNMGLTDDTFHQVFPIILNKANDSMKISAILSSLLPRNCTYVVYNEKKDLLNAVTIQPNCLPEIDSLYYALIDGEEMLSNNNKILEEFTSDIIYLPPNHYYSEKKVKKITLN